MWFYGSAERLSNAQESASEHPCLAQGERNCPSKLIPFTVPGATNLAGVIGASRFIAPLSRAWYHQSDDLNRNQRFRSVKYLKRV